MLVCAALLALGGVISWLTITHGPVVMREDEPDRPPATSSHQVDCPTRGH
jgi:hypothetical protein